MCQNANYCITTSIGIAVSLCVYICVSVYTTKHGDELKPPVLTCEDVIAVQGLCVH